MPIYDVFCSVSEIVIVAANYPRCSLMDVSPRSERSAVPPHDLHGLIGKPPAALSDSIVNQVEMLDGL
jgi:hypothetical protein